MSKTPKSERGQRNKQARQDALVIIQELRGKTKLTPDETARLLQALVKWLGLE
jgi:hypothetical protein